MSTPINFESVPPDLREGMLLLIDKPLSWTSFDVVNKIRYMLRNELGYRKIKVGHAGTLDPLASGLLIVCVGRLTKSIDQFMAEEKTYTGEITFGCTTPSYDAETEPDSEYETRHLSLESIRKAAEGFVGKIQQVPPIYSAKKVGGKKAYEEARKGNELVIPAAEVEIRSFTISDFTSNKASFEVSCSKGTYIRSLAHDLGKALNSGAYLSGLRRTGSGSFHVSSALSIEELREKLVELRESGHQARANT